MGELNDRVLTLGRSRTTVPKPLLFSFGYIGPEAHVLGKRRHDPVRAFHALQSGAEQEPGYWGIEGSGSVD